MKKKEAIEKIEKRKSTLNSWEELTRNRAFDEALDIVRKIDETGLYYIKDTDTTPPHYQGTIQPIDLINAQDLNFNLGNVVKYVCRAGKKQGENILTDLEKAKDYIDFEIERVKK